MVSRMNVVYRRDAQRLAKLALVKAINHAYLAPNTRSVLLSLFSFLAASAGNSGAVIAGYFDA